jgi:hypothetical protein
MGVRKVTTTPKGFGLQVATKDTTKDTTKDATEVATKDARRD